MKIKYLVILLFMAVVFSSCEDFLDVQPEGDPASDSFFLNDGQAIDAIDGLYSRIPQGQIYGRDLFWEQAAACDIVWARTRSFNTLATFNYTGDESPLTGVFGYMYKIISRSNFVIKELLKKEKNSKLSAVEHRSLGEAYFVRGMTHFLIAYRYGLKEQGVPFIRYEDFEGEYDNSIPPQQGSVIDNYKLIIEDFDKAIQYLPRYEEYSDEDRGRAHQLAAVGYKAKVYAYWATWDETKWQDVIKMVNLMEDKYGRDLAPDFAQNFSSELSDFWTAEYVWTIPSNGGTSGGGVSLPGVMLENTAWGIYNGWGQLKPTYNIYEEMLKDGEGNERLVNSILEYNQDFEFFGEKRKYYSTTDLDVGFQVNKYMDAFKHKDATDKGYVNPNGDWPTTRINFPLIRFAEMLLFRAEAYLVTGNPAKAKEDLNRIRRRSNLSELLGTPTMADLYHERRCELAFEYTDHLFDLKRWHRSSNAEIKALATKELNAHPLIRKYENRGNPESAFTIEPYADYKNKNTYQDYMMVFPYPSEQITKANGNLKQNPGY